MIVGIDLGTTFSLVAVSDAAGPRVIRDADGEARLPSVLGFGSDGRVTVGWEARRQAVENPEHTVYSVKRLMGLGLADLDRELPYLSYHVVRGERDTIEIEIEGTRYSPQQVSALILRELKERAERELGRPVRRAVVTVPAYFDDAQRQATRDAGQIAGLEVLRIVNEPTAAALAYGIGAHGSRETGTTDRRGAALPVGDRSKCTASDAADGGSFAQSETTNVAVYDLGGGTFDVSILRLSGDVFEVVATCGDTHLGGDDFDRTIIDLVRREVSERFGVDIDSPRTRQALRLLAEQTKIRLSDADEARIELDLGGGRIYERTIARSEFEAMIGPLVERSIDACRRALSDAAMQPERVGQVVLVGGSTRLPLVRRRVAEAFGRTPYTALNPDEVVALGAAVQAQILAGGRSDALLLDITPLSLGIETMGGAMGKLIMRNTRIPCQATERFTTFVDGQTNVKIHVLQGERELAADCRSLAEFDLRGIPPMPAGIPKIDVQFLIDANGILNVTAREERSGRQAQVQVVPAHGLTCDEVRRMERESVERAREDMTAHRLIDLRNQVEFDAHKTEQALKAHGHLLGDDRRAEFEAAVQRLRELAVTEEDADRLHAELDRFGKMTVDLANVALREALREQEDGEPQAPGVRAGRTD